MRLRDIQSGGLSNLSRFLCKLLAETDYFIAAKLENHVVINVYLPTNYSNEKSVSRFASACKLLGRFVKKVASNSVITSGDFNVDITNSKSPISQIFWDCVPHDYCVLPKNDNFSYIRSPSSTSSLDHVVASFGSHEVKVSKEGFYSDRLPIFTCFYSSQPMAQNTNQIGFPAEIGKMCQVSPSVEYVARCGAKSKCLSIFYAIVLCCHKVKRKSQLSSLPTCHK